MSARRTWLSRKRLLRRVKNFTPALISFARLFFACPTCVYSRRTTRWGSSRTIRLRRGNCALACLLHPARRYSAPCATTRALRAKRTSFSLMARAARFKKGFCSYLNQPRAVQKRARQGSQAFGSRSLVKPKWLLSNAYSKRSIAQLFELRMCSSPNMRPGCSKTS